MSENAREKLNFHKMIIKTS